MGDMYCKVSKEKTKRTKIYVEKYKGKEYRHEENYYTRCFLCYKSECDLFGVHSTGGFSGICEDCLKKLNKIYSGEVEYI